MELEALGQCILPPRAGDVMTSWLLCQRPLVHALLFSITQRTQLIPLSLSPNSDESGKQSLYPDGDPDRHQNLTRMWANAQRDGACQI